MVTAMRLSLDAGECEPSSYTSLLAAAASGRLAPSILKGVFCSGFLLAAAAGGSELYKRPRLFSRAPAGLRLLATLRPERTSLTRCF